MVSQIIGNSRDVIALILLFGVTIFVHELGHFLVARWCGMVVDTFSIGFGPAIWKRKVKATTYKIGWIPFGGYVALPQLDPSGMTTIQGKRGGQEGAGEQESDEPPAGRDLPPISPWKKIAVSLAGVSGNLVFAVGLAWIVYLSPNAPVTEKAEAPVLGFVDTNSLAFDRGLRSGDEIVAVNGEKVKSWNDVSMLCLLGTGRTNEVTVSLKSDGRLRDLQLPIAHTELDAPMVEGIGKSAPCVVNGVMPGSSAEEAGFKEGDIIRELDGVVVASTEHFVNLVQKRGDREVPVLLDRAGQLIERRVKPRFNSQMNKMVVGVTIGSGREAMVVFWMQYKEPMAQIKSDSMLIFRTLRALVTPREAKQAAKGLGGPVLIIAALWVAIKLSALNAVGFLRFLNVNLAILNLLPIPVLDGGHVVFALWEGIFRRRANPKVVNVLVNVFATLLISAIVLLSLRDIMRAPKMLRAFGLLKAEAEAQAQTNAAPASTNAVIAPQPVDNVATNPGK